MQTSTIVIAILFLGAVAFRVGRRRSLVLVGGSRGVRNLHSLPGYYGLLTAPFRPSRSSPSGTWSTSA